MPQLGHFRTKRIYLPSFDDPKDKAWVEVALDYPLKWVSDLNEDNPDKGWIFAAKLIQAWNLTDAKGKAVPINVDTVKELNHTDQNAIMEAIKEIGPVSKLSKQEKKS